MWYYLHHLLDKFVLVDPVRLLPEARGGHTIFFLLDQNQFSVIQNQQGDLWMLCYTNTIFICDKWLPSASVLNSVAPNPKSKPTRPGLIPLCTVQAYIIPQSLLILPWPAALYSTSIHRCYIPYPPLLTVSSFFSTAEHDANVHRPQPSSGY